jgi:hypothetical protein
MGGWSKHTAQIGVSPEELEYLFDDEFEGHVDKLAAEGGGALYIDKTRNDGEGACSFAAASPSSLSAPQTMRLHTAPRATLHTSRPSC